MKIFLQKMMAGIGWALLVLSFSVFVWAFLQSEAELPQDEVFFGKIAEQSFEGEVFLQTGRVRVLCSGQDLLLQTAEGNFVYAEGRLFSLLQEGRAETSMQSEAGNLVEWILDLYVPPDASITEAVEGLMEQYLSDGVTYLFFEGRLKSVQSPAFLFVFSAFGETVNIELPPEIEVPVEPEEPIEPEEPEEPEEPDEPEEAPLIFVQVFLQKQSDGVSVVMETTTFFIHLRYLHEDYFLENLLTGYTEIFVDGEKKVLDGTGANSPTVNAVLYLYRSYMNTLAALAEDGGFDALYNDEGGLLRLIMQNSDFKYIIEFDKETNVSKIEVFEGDFWLARFEFLSVGESVIVL